MKQKKVLSGNYLTVLQISTLRITKGHLFITCIIKKSITAQFNVGIRNSHEITQNRLGPTKLRPLKGNRQNFFHHIFRKIFENKSAYGDLTLYTKTLSAISVQYTYTNIYQRRITQISAVDQLTNKHTQNSLIN